jgi:hypothetical protein
MKTSYFSKHQQNPINLPNFKINRNIDHSLISNRATLKSSVHDEFKSLHFLGTPSFEFKYPKSVSIQDYEKVIEDCKLELESIRRTENAFVKNFGMPADFTIKASGTFISTSCLPPLLILGFLPALCFSMVFSKKDNAKDFTEPPKDDKKEEKQSLTDVLGERAVNGAKELSHLFTKDPDKVLKNLQNTEAYLQKFQDKINAVHQARLVKDIDELSPEQITLLQQGFSSPIREMQNAHRNSIQILRTFPGFYQLISEKLNPKDKEIYQLEVIKEIKKLCDFPEPLQQAEGLTKLFQLIKEFEIKPEHYFNYYAQAASSPHDNVRKIAWEVLAQDETIRSAVPEAQWKALLKDQFLNPQNFTQQWEIPLCLLKCAKERPFFSRVLTNILKRYAFNPPGDTPLSIQQQAKESYQSIKEDYVNRYWIESPADEMATQILDNASLMRSLQAPLTTFLKQYDSYSATPQIIGPDMILYMHADAPATFISDEINRMVFELQKPMVLIDFSYIKTPQKLRSMIEEAKPLTERVVVIEHLEKLASLTDENQRNDIMEILKPIFEKKSPEFKGAIVVAATSLPLRKQPLYEEDPLADAMLQRLEGMGTYMKVNFEKRKDLE